MDKLTPNQIFTKTIKYVLLRMCIPIAAAVISLIARAVLTKTLMASLLEKEVKLATLICTAIWLVITVVAYLVLDTFVGYRFRASQMAIITDAVSVNMIPDDMNDLAKESLAYRFPSGNEFYAYKKAVKGSIQQLQMYLNTFAENRMRIPVVKQLIQFAQWVIGHALSFTFDLVLCYTFWRDGKTLFVSAADGVAVYWDSWKRLFSNVLMLAVMIILGLGLGFLLIGVIVAVMCSPASGPLLGGCTGVAIGFFACKAAKVIIDSNLTIKTLDAFLEEAQYADYNAEEYENMCKQSKRYEKLYRKAQNEAFAPPPTTPESGAYIG